MDSSVIIWICILSILVVTFLVKTLHTALMHHEHTHRKKLSLPHHIVEVGSEREEMYVPGDLGSHCNYKNEYDEEIDL